MKRLVSAAYVATMAGSLIRDGAIVCDDGGMIVDVGAERTMRGAHADAQRVEHGHAIILPGLVNAHTHLELSNCKCEDAPASFVDWILSISVLRASS